MEPFKQNVLANHNIEIASEGNRSNPAAFDSPTVMSSDHATASALFSPSRAKPEDAAIEPWERSLSRMLLQARALPQNGSFRGSNRNIPSFPRHSMSELILLGRSESRDYALEIEAGSSNSHSNPASNYSSRNASPVRSRNIYRSPPPGSQSLMDSSSSGSCDDEEEDGEDVQESRLQRDTFSRGLSRGLMSMGHSNRSCSCTTSSGTTYTNNELYEEEARGELDIADRESDNDILRNAAVADGRRSFPIRKARALREEDDHMDWLTNPTDRGGAAPLALPDLRLPLL